MAQYHTQQIFQVNKRILIVFSIKYRISYRSYKNNNSSFGLRNLLIRSFKPWNFRSWFQTLYKFESLHFKRCRFWILKWKKVPVLFTWKFWWVRKFSFVNFKPYISFKYYTFKRCIFWITERRKSLLHKSPFCLLFRTTTQQGAIHKLRWQARGRGVLAKCKRYYNITYLILWYKHTNKEGGRRGS